MCTAAYAHFGLCVSPTGDILTSINGVNTEGFGHKQIVDLIKSSGNYLRWVCLLQMGFGLISCPTEGRIVLPHSPALSERQKSQGLGWVEPLCFRASITCSHRLETVNGALFLRKMELETKLQALKVIRLINYSTVKWRGLCGFTADGGRRVSMGLGSWQGLTPVGSLLPAPPAAPALDPLILFFGNGE